MENYIDFRKIKDYDKLILPSQIIKDGGIVVFPTETVYGIGTNGLNEKAIKRLYEIKKRPFNKPISLLVSDMEMIERLTENITKEEYKLMKTFFPGPLTIILKKKKIVPDILTANTDTVGIRMPGGSIARKLVEYANVPIAAPSANISGNSAGTNIYEIMNEFEHNVDYYIDEGNSKLGIGSTIVKIIEGKPNILRQGSITKKQIYKCLSL